MEKLKHKNGKKKKKLNKDKNFLVSIYLYQDANDQFMKKHVGHLKLNKNNTQNCLKYLETIKITVYLAKEM